MSFELDYHYTNESVAQNKNENKEINNLELRTIE